MMRWWKERRRYLDDFAAFGRAVIRSGDIDPQFWILRDIYDVEKLSTNEALWRTAIYLTFYHLGSAVVAWKLYETPDTISKKAWNDKLPFFKQRRCFRGNDYPRKHLNQIVRLSNGDLTSWVGSIEPEGEDGWTRACEQIAQITHHGPWSSYKWCDMLKFVHGYPITAPDIGNKPGDTAGPIAGLQTLTGLDRDKCATDNKLHRDLLKCIIEEYDVPAIGLDQLESVLCDYQSLRNGKYYVGHDIDRDQDQLEGIQDERAYWLWESRQRVFDWRLLGELNGWCGVRSHLNSLYQRRKRLINAQEDIKVVKTI